MIPPPSTLSSPSTLLPPSLSLIVRDYQLILMSIIHGLKLKTEVFDLHFGIVNFPFLVRLK